MNIIRPRDLAGRINTCRLPLVVYLHGDAPGKYIYADTVNECLREIRGADPTAPDPEFVSVGSSIRDSLSVIDASDALTRHRRTTEAIFLRSRKLDESSVRIALGIATALGGEYVRVDNFNTPDAVEAAGYPLEAAPGPNPSLSWCIVVDLDGTLYNSDHRSHWNFDPEEILSDTVVPHVAQIVDLYSLTLRQPVFFLTGRGASAGEKEATLRQLSLIGFDSNHPRNWFLHTRAVGDYRNDAVVKLEMYNQHIRGKYNVSLVLDDRPRVIRMWQELGLPVLAARPGERGEF